MRTAVGVWALVFALVIGQTRAQSGLKAGLKGEYYTGTHFERKVMTRVDPQIRFDWSERKPAAGLGYSFYSVRWTGQLLAPATGRYTFYAKVDDGIRIWVGNQKVMDAWYLNDSQRFTGSVVLQAGQYYDLRVDYFNDIVGGVIDLYWQRPDDKTTRPGLFGTPGEPISGRYFRQSAPPVAARPRPVTRPVILVAPTKPAARLVANRLPPKLRPVAPVPPAKPPVRAAKLPADTVAAPVSATPKPVSPLRAEPAPGETFVLRHVWFAQSSYELLPESSVELDRWVQTLTKHPQWRIEVAGHTDNVGDPRLNLGLSENRANVVASYLVRRGIADERVEPKGYGGTRPVADNAVENERPKNRRVEIVVR